MGACLCDQSQSEESIDPQHALEEKRKTMLKNVTTIEFNSNTNSAGSRFIRSTKQDRLSVDQVTCLSNVLEVLVFFFLGDAKQ